MNSTKKLMIVLISAVLFFACDNGAKEELEQCKVEALHAVKLAKEAQVEALSHKSLAEKMAADAIVAQVKAEELAVELLKCKGGK